MDRLKIGILGVGGAGRAQTNRFLNNKHVGEIILFDVKEINFTKKVNGFDLPHIDFSKFKMFHDFDKFIANVDAVSICSPDYSHYEYIVKSLDAGKHVLAEKPMVASSEEANNLEEVVKRHSDLKFAIHHQMRFVPAFKRAKKIIETGTLGDIFYIEANYWHNMRKRATLFDDWRVEGQGQSLILGYACHPLDLILHLVGNDIVSHDTYLSKNAFKDFYQEYTSSTTMIKFRNGIVAKSHTNSCVRYLQHNNIVILGDEGSYIDGVLYKDGRFHKLVQYHDKGEKLSFKKSLGNGIRNLMSTTLLRTPGFRATPFTVYNHEGACQVIIDNFIDAILTGELVLVGYEDGRRVIKLCEEAERDGLARGVSG